MVVPGLRSRYIIENSLPNAGPESGGLTDNQRVKLCDVLRYNLASARADLLKEPFQDFWDYDSPTWAGEFLDRWTSQVMRSRIEPTASCYSTTSAPERRSPAA